jgi:hypothetical protein
MIRKLVKGAVYWSTLLVLLANTSAVSASTLADYLLEKNEKLSVIEGHSQPQPQLSSLAVKPMVDNVEASKQTAKKNSPLARAMAQSPINTDQNKFYLEKNLTLDISELKDNSGLVYLGAKVPEVELSRYLSQLKSVLGDKQYAIYRQHQAARDHQSFHVTLVNPYEYQTINKEKLKISQKIRVTLHGVGKVAKGEKTSYFVVASSSDGQFLRQKLLLKNKDFHVTLGFYSDDVYGVSKGRDTLINK